MAALASSVAVVATVRNPSLLNLALRRPGVLDAVLDVPPLDGEARSAILRAILERYECEQALDMDACTARIEGCRPGDIEVLVSRAVHHALVRCEEDVSQGVTLLVDTLHQSEE
jgi:transitional endoplasmic reticulum ATPase